MTKFEEAVVFAVNAHSGMIRKIDGTPYILHPMEAAAIAGTLINDEALLCAAILHDVVEDAGVTEKEIRETFGDDVADLVMSETEDKMRDLPASVSWKTRKDKSVKFLRECTDVRVKALYLSDKLANLRSFLRHHSAEGDALWQKFNMKDKREHEKYYRSILQAVSELKNTGAWNEMSIIIDKLFAEGSDE